MSSDSGQGAKRTASEFFRNRMFGLSAVFAAVAILAGHYIWAADPWLATFFVGMAVPFWAFARIAITTPRVAAAAIAVTALVAGAGLVFYSPMAGTLIEKVLAGLYVFLVGSLGLIALWPPSGRIRLAMPVSARRSGGKSLSRVVRSRRNRRGNIKDRFSTNFRNARWRG